MDHTTKIKIHSKRPEGFSPIVEVVALYCFSGEKTLFMKRSPGKDYANCWGVPAGKIEAGEGVKEALFREVHEEIGLKLAEKDVAEVGTYFAEHAAYDFVYHAFACSFDAIPDLMLSDEHTDFIWGEKDQILSLTLVPGARETYQFFLSSKEMGLC